MRFLSVCSGIEAASVAWAPLGWKAWAFSEIEPFPCSLLAHHYPNVPNLGDMTKFQDWPLPDEPIDLLCGGTPCQSFSVAGLRKGLADPRGNLMLTYLAIADKYRPRWLVWENVPGVLSSNDGRDFGTFLGGLGQLGYGFAYRVLDAQYFGVAQRRRRVFVVGHLGDWRRAAAVLFERHSLQGRPAPRRETGQGVAGTLSERTQGGGGLGTDFELGGGLIPQIVGQAMSAKWAKGTAGPAGPAGDEHHNLIAVPDVSSTLLAQGNNTGGDRPPGTPVDTCDQLIPYVTHALRGEGFDASEDGTGRGTPLVPIAFSAKDHGADAMSNLAPTLRAGGHADSHANAGVMPAIAFDPTQVTSATNRSNPQPGDPCHTLTKGAHAPAIAIQGAATRENPASGPDGIGVRTDNAAYTLEARSEVQAVQTGMQVRRLTPRECERLQGFPDDYTRVPHGKSKATADDVIAIEDDNGVWHYYKPAADGPRYKALGNSWAVPCARWIGERIAAADNIPITIESKAA